MKVQRVSSSHVSTINASIDNNTLLSISYVDSKGVPSVRTIEPYEIKNNLLYAHCRVKNATRAFKVTQIQSIEELKETFVPRY